ncbi:MAG TPA: type II secretion system protein [Thermoanaerobaculia bacterium]|nr:type II secretion system protein [Thermoanaerobaculia bacterium]
MRDERGFSLVEIMAAFLILTFVITTSLWAFLERNKRLQQASEIILAYQALANEAEYRRRDPYAQVETEPIFFKSDTTLLTPLAPYAAAVKVDLVKPGVKNVTMTIRWKNGEREARLGIVRVDTLGGPLF